jgi:hypothetical protein
MQYAIIAEHPPELCPVSNGKIREMLKQAAKELPGLAENLGVKIVTLNIFGPDHVILAVVEAADIEVVRSFAFQSRLMQWNTVKIHATWSLQEVLSRLDSVPTIF